MRKFLNAISKFALVALIATSIIPLAPLKSAQAVAPNWNATGNYTFRFVLGGDYDYDVNLAQDGSGNLTGTGNYPVGGPTSYSWTLSSGSVDGNTISFVAPYTAGPDALTPLTTLNVTGTITAGGLMSGTWTDNYQGNARNGTWSAITGTASPIVVGDTTVVITGDTTATENTAGGWMFNRDTSTDTPFEFNTDENSIGTGSLEVFPIGANPSDKMISELFLKKQISEVNTISFDYKMGALPTTANQFYMNVYAQYAAAPENKYYDCRYDVIASTGSTASFSTLTFDPTQSYFVQTSGSTTVPGPCPASPSGMGAGAKIRAIALTLGDTSGSDAGMSGYFDNVVVDLDSGKTTYDFEPRSRVNVTVEKIWKDANGEETDAPDNANDITITVTPQDDDSVDCNYDDGELVCEDDISGFSDDSFEVEETGLPAGWEVDKETVGDEIYPVCPVVEEDTKVANVECTITVINQRIDAAPCGTDIVANGDFETPDVEDNGGQWQLFPSGTEGMKWSVDGGDMEFQAGYSGWNDNTSGGSQYAELDSTNNTTIFQDLSTKAGGKYTVSLFTSPRPNDGGGNVNAADNAMTVSMGDTVLDIIAEDGTGLTQTNWTEHTYTFTASGPVTRLSISGTGTSNGLGGFVDDVSVIEECLSDVEICKVDQNDNPLSGWNVFLKGEEQESVEVPAASSEAVTSEDSLEVGQNYLLVATGTAEAGDGITFDADYSYRTPTSTTWTDSVSTYEGLGDQLLDLKVNGNFVNWDNDAVYNTNHTYTYQIAGNGAPVSFLVNDVFPSNNTGSLEVAIYPIIKGVTGKGGCVTLPNVPYDSYTLDEMMQSGWSNVDGKGDEVTVDGDSSSFTLVNQCDDNCVSSVKICKEDIEGNPLAGWNVYLKGPKLGKTLYLDSADVAGVSSSLALESGMDYEVEISGEWQNRGFETVDASFTTPDGWDTVLAGPQGGYPDDLLETQINNAFVNWGPYSEDHSYSLTMSGTGSVANFRVYDMASGNPTDMDPSWYGDNDGDLTIKIYPIYQGVTTGEDGCVTLENVPFGNYTLGETMQEGWVNESGDGSQVIVNEPSEPGLNVEENPFVLVNECTSESCQEPVPCTVEPVMVSSGAATYFEGLKESGPAPLDLSNSVNYPSGTAGGAQPAAPTGYAGAWDGSAIAGAVYVSNDSTQPTFTGGAGHDGSVDSWRLFSHTFTIPAGAVGISTPVLHFAADNEVTVYLDNAFIGSSASFSSVTDTAPLVLTPGTHTLEFAVKNYAFDQTNNPTGVIYRLDDITYSCDAGGDDELDTITGLVYNDVNQDGNQDEGENGIEGLQVKLIAVVDESESNGNELTESEVDSTTSDVNGNYQFDAVEAGCYIVREIPDGYTQYEPQENTAHEYYISVGGAICGNPEFTLESLFFKTALAASDSVVFVAYVGQDLKFGNFDNGQGGNGGNGGSSGSRPNGSDRPGQVLGDSTTIPSSPLVPQVLGATLPVTGTPLAAILLVMASLALIVVSPKVLSIKKN